MFGLPGLSGIGLLEWLKNLIRGKPERRRVTCPTCAGLGLCRHCDGRGCEVCKNTGHCPTCDGNGALFI